MNTTRKSKPAAPRRKPAPPVTPEQRRALVRAAVFDNTVAQMDALRQQLVAGECPATVTEPERRAAVADLSRALMQLDNLRRHYGPGACMRRSPRKEVSE